MRNPNTTCHECDAPVYIRPGQMSRQAHWLCNRKCYDKFVLDNRGKPCDHCGEFYKARDSAAKYCSRSCSNKARKGISYKRGRPNCKITQSNKQRQLLVLRDGEGCQGAGCPINGSEWLGKPITLQIEHIDANRKNNDLANLILLCPNCHSQTESWSKPKGKLNALHI